MLDVCVSLIMEPQKQADMLACQGGAQECI